MVAGPRAQPLQVDAVHGHRRLVADAPVPLRARLALAVAHLDAGGHVALHRQVHRLRGQPLDVGAAHHPRAVRRRQLRVHLGAALRRPRVHLQRQQVVVGAQEAPPDRQVVALGLPPAALVGQRRRLGQGDVRQPPPGHLHPVQISGEPVLIAQPQEQAGQPRQSRAPRRSAAAGRASRYKKAPRPHPVPRPAGLAARTLPASPAAPTPGRRTPGRPSPARHKTHRGPPATAAPDPQGIGPAPKYRNSSPWATPATSAMPATPTRRAASATPRPGSFSLGYKSQDYHRPQPPQASKGDRPHSGVSGASA